MATTTSHPSPPPPAPVGAMDGGWAPAGLSTAEAYRQLRAHDPLLIAALHAGDPPTIAAVSRVLRLTPLAQLATDTGALVTALAALPDLSPVLATSWRRQDPVLARRIIGWAERSRHHHRHPDEQPLPAA